jgi:hypothetical protein
MGAFLGKWQRTTYQIRHPLPQGVIEALEWFVDARLAMARIARRELHLHTRHTDSYRISPADSRLEYLGPQLLDPLATAIVPMDRNSLVGSGVHRQLYPLLVRLLLDTAR